MFWSVAGRYDVFFLPDHGVQQMSIVFTKTNT